MSRHWNLAPRYTAGSPAAVWDEALARRVAAEEKEDYERTLEGVYGPELQERARKLGLGGIVEERFEIPNGWKVVDLITGQRFRRLRKEARKLKVGDIVTSLEMTPGTLQGRFRVTYARRSQTYGIILTLDDMSVTPPLPFRPSPLPVSEYAPATIETDEVAP